MFLSFTEDLVSWLVNEAERSARLRERSEEGGKRGRVLLIIIFFSNRENKDGVITCDDLQLAIERLLAVTNQEVRLYYRYFIDFLFLIYHPNPNSQTIT